MAPKDDGFYDELSRLNSELVNLQRQLAKRNAELHRLNELKNQFLGMAAHDLRKPVGAVMAYGEFLLDEVGPTLGDDHRGFLEVIVRSAQRMRGLIDDFLDAALIEAGSFELDYEPVEVGTLVEQLVEVVEPAARRHDVTLTVELEPGLPAVPMDRGKIEQVLLNLVSNSVEHGDRGTRVVLRARVVGDSLRLVVSDDGPGIAPEQLATLFLLSGRRRGHKASGERSVGLGLVIVKKIVEAHGGSIQVNSTLGEGTTTTVDLPASAAA